VVETVLDGRRWNWNCGDDFDIGGYTYYLIGMLLLLILRNIGEKEYSIYI